MSSSAIRLLSKLAHKHCRATKQSITTKLDTAAEDDVMDDRAHQVRAQLNFGAVLDEELERGDGGPDACVIRDVLVLVQRHIKIGPHQYLHP